MRSTALATTAQASTLGGALTLRSVHLLVIPLAIAFILTLCSAFTAVQSAHAATDKAVKITTTYKPDSSSWARGNYSYNDRYLIQGISKSGKTVWTKSTPKFYTRLYNSIGICTQGKGVYVYASGKLYKYMLSNGKRAWVCKGLKDAPEVSNFACLYVTKKGYSYVVNNEGKVFKINPKGKIVWGKQTNITYRPGVTLEKRNHHTYVKVYSTDAIRAGQSCYLKA